ncbi:MAG: hypothetical protein ABF242_04715 [Flavobacteriales bacterium]
MNLINFIIGALLANAMPHFIFGLAKTHYLGLFGYSPKGNIAYGVLQFVIAIILLFINYSFEQILQNGFVLGALSVLVLFFVFGKFSVKFFEEKR